MTKRHITFGTALLASACLGAHAFFNESATISSDDVRRVSAAIANCPAIAATVSQYLDGNGGLITRSAMRKIDKEHARCLEHYRSLPEALSLSPAYADLRKLLRDTNKTEIDSLSNQPANLKLSWTLQSSKKNGGRSRRFY